MRTLSFCLCVLGVKFALCGCGLAATYHVGVTGNDENPGTRDKPFRTINRAAEMAKAGDTVIVGPGRYHEYVIVPNSGTPDKPITFRASGEGETIVSAAHPLTGFSKTAGTRNVYEADIRAAYPQTGALECYGLIDDTTLYAYTMLPSLEACDVVPASFYLDRKARRIYVHTSDSGAPSAHKLELSTKYATFYVSPAVSRKPAMSDIIIEGFTIKHVWRQRAGAVVFSHKAQRAVLRNCRIENCWRGVEVSQDAEDCVVENCDVVNCVDGIRFSYLRRGRVVNNRVVRRGEHWPYQPSKPSVGIYFYCFYRDGDNMAWIQDNYIEGYGNGIRLKSPAVAVCRNNTMVDCAAGILARTGPRREFVNNLLINCDTPLTIAGEALPDEFVTDYNCAYDHTNPTRAEEWLRTWRGLSGQAQHTIVAPPKITGTWPYPMSLSPDSPCVGAGQNGAHIGSLAVAAPDRPSQDRRPPVGRISCGGQAVGGAAVLIRDANVALQIAARDGEGPVTAMRFSNDAERWSAPVPFAWEYPWILASGDGKKVIYARFQDQAGNWSVPVTTEVWYVRRAPPLAGGAEAATDHNPRHYYVSMNGSDDGPGTAKEPWRTLAQPARSALPGDTVTVRAGIYYEPLVPSRGGTSEERRIAYRADGRVIIERGQKWPFGVLLQDLKFVTIEGFECRGYTRSGVHVEGCSDIVIRRNKIHSGLAQRLTQRKPYVGTYGLYVKESQRVNVEYNQLFWNSHNLVFYFTKDCRADHNTTIDTVYSGLAIWGTYPGLRLTNNIIVHNGNAQFSISLPPESLTSDYNCLLKAERSKCMFEVTKRRKGREGWQTLEEWQKDFGLESHSISADPLFVDEDNGDLRLREASPCISAAIDGTNMGAL